MPKQLFVLLLGALTSTTAWAAANATVPTLCDKYSAALLGASNATTQLTLLTLLVNTAVIGNYSNASHSAVPGILNPNATYEGKKVNLVQYFDGSLMSSNEGGKPGSMNFLDDGGAVPLTMNKPANGTSSNQ